MAVFFKICFINVEDSIIGDDRKKTQFTLYFTIAIDNHIGLVFWCRTYSVGRTKKCTSDTNISQKLLHIFK